MNKERELLKECRLILDTPFNGSTGINLRNRITELLTQPEPIEEKFDRVKSNREFYQAGYAEAERKLKPEQEQVPVAWITEWVQRYRNNDTTIMDRAVSFTKGAAPAVPNPNYIPLYLAPQKRERLSEDEIFNIGYKAGFAIDHVESDDGESTDYGFIDGDGYIDNDLVFKFVRGIEKAHGIGGEE